MLIAPFQAKRNWEDKGPRIKKKKNLNTIDQNANVANVTIFFQKASTSVFEFRLWYRFYNFRKSSKNIEKCI